MNTSGSKKIVFLIYVALIVTTVVCYWSIRNFDFITFDDPGYVWENPHVTTGLTLNNLIWAFTTGRGANWHPLTWLSLILDCQLFGPNPQWMHLMNLLFHIGNTLLLFAILKKITSETWPSAFVAALFAIHPMHVESVVWVTERKDVLSTFFWLLTMAAYIPYAQRGGRFRYVLTLGLFACGLMAKPMLVTLPFVLLLLDYWPLNRFEPQRVKVSLKSQKLNNQNWQAIAPGRSTFTGLLIEKIPFFILVAASSVITFFVQRSSGAVINTYSISLPSRFANAFVSYGEYIIKMFWPTNLSIYYPLPKAGWQLWQVAISVLLLSAISYLVIRFGRRRKYLAVGWFWYVGTLIPVIGIVQVGMQAYADRYTYVPYIGLFIMIAWGLPDLLSKIAYRKIILGVSTAIILTVLGICTIRQASYWKNGETVFKHAIEVTRDNYVAHEGLGNIFLWQNKPALAIRESSKAIEINPTWANAYINLGAAFVKQGQYAAALEQFRKSIELNPKIAGAYYNLGEALGKQGRYYEALEQFREAIRLEPDWTKPMDELAFMIAAHPELKNRDVNEAISFARRSCELTDYKNTAYLCTLADVYASDRKFSEAAQTIETALKVAPNSADLHSRLGKALLFQGKFAEAIGELKRSIEIEPNNAEIKNNLAWILANCPNANMRDPSEAIRLARRACELTNYNNPAMLGTLADSYASAGKFAEAINIVQMALSMADKNDKNLIGHLQHHLSLYQNAKQHINDK